MRLSDLSEAVVEGNTELAERLTREALKEGIAASVINREGLIPGMEIVGKKMQSGEFFIPEVLLSAQVMKQALEIIKPALGKTESPSRMGKVVMGTVRGDLHDIGKNLVIAMLEGAGFQVIDLGVDVPPKRFVDTVKEAKADILGLSALLTVTMLNMREVMSSLSAAGLRSEVKVMVGGASLSKRFADEIGADGYAPDAAGAVDLAKSMLKVRGQ